jgi:hypothetical protein
LPYHAAVMSPVSSSVLIFVLASPAFFGLPGRVAMILTSCKVTFLALLSAVCLEGATIVSVAACSSFWIPSTFGKMHSTIGARMEIPEKNPDSKT